MTLLLDTHFFIWIITGSRRLQNFPWLARYQPWTISPLSFLEIKFLSEVGKLEAKSYELMEAVMNDPRFIFDEVPLVAFVRNALGLDWTRDPFDRLLCSHSQSRRIPLCSVDKAILRNHPLIPAELMHSGKR